MTGTWEVLRRRAAEGSRPGDRRDGARVALVLEGGGNRAAYSAGMALALEQHGLLDAVDAVYGTSGGALNGAWLLTGDAQAALPLWASPSYAAERVVDPRRLLRGGPVVDLEHLLHHVYVHVFPMAFEVILQSPVELHPIATDARTGRATDLAPTVHDTASLQTALRASAALPLLAGGPVAIGANRYVDGGVAEPVPVRTALAQGATHVLVLRTRRADQQVTRAPAVERVALSAWLALHAPGARRPYLRRHLSHVEDEAAFARSASVVQVRPPLGSVDVTRLTGDLSRVGEGLASGASAMADELQRNGLSPLSA